MNFRLLTQDMRISFRKSVAVSLLTSGSIALFFLIPWIGVDKILFYGFAALSAILGSIVSERIERRKIFLPWILLGILSTLFLGLSQGPIFISILSILLGISLGFGISSCLASLAESTLIEERTRISGIIILETFAIVFLVMFVAQTFNFGLTQRIILVAAVRSLSLFPLILDQLKSESNKRKSYLAILTHKNFVFYLFPWIFFNIAAGLSYWWSNPVEPGYKLVPSLAIFYVCAALFAVVSGVVADRFGRKLPIIIGIVMGGISFAILGFSVSSFSFLVSNSVLGVAWGFLLVVYLAIPGDIALSFAKEKFYALGTITPLILYLGISAVPRSKFVVNISQISSILSILLFLAVIPIILAKETLPENKMNNRKLKEYMVKLGKVMQDSKEEK